MIQQGVRVYVATRGAEAGTMPWRLNVFDGSGERVFDRIGKCAEYGVALQNLWHKTADATRLSRKVYTS